MLERFLFDRSMHHLPIGRLSGGERRRLYLLGILMQAPNVLLLDEPTNDLDITTLCILEEYLEHFAGPIIAVSHDRYFLDKLAGAIFCVQPDGQIAQYSGNYSDYLARQAELQPEPPAEKKAPTHKPQPPKTQKLKFSFREQREYETIDADIAALEQQLQQAEAAIAASGCDYLKLEQAMTEQARLQQLLDEKMERWVYLNELAEKIEAQRT